MIHTKTLAALALAMMALAACGPKPAAKPKADTDALASLPKPKPGLWEQSTTIEGGGALTNRVCLDDATSAELASRGANPPGSTCATPVVDKAPGLIKITSTCKLQDGGKFTSVSTETGDMQSAYTTVVEWSVTGSPTLSTQGSKSQSVAAKFAGPCPGGWQPGDVELANGQRLNLLHPAATATKPAS